MIPTDANQNTQQPLDTKENIQISKILVGFAIGIVFLLLFLIILNYFNLISLSGFVNKISGGNNLFSQSVNANKIIAKVGEENIYEKDLDTELSYYPIQTNANQKNIKTMLLKKIIKDSITLQAGAKEGFIHLDNTTFNANAKDYQKRMTQVAQVKSAILARQDKITGSVITIWFYNNAKPTTMDSAQAKQIALSKITSVYNLVKSKKLTMQQAAQQIQADSSLAQIDIAYKSNAILEFTNSPKEKVVFDETFNSKIRQLQPGQLTDIYLAKDYDIKTKLQRDAVYMFAQVTDRKISGINDTYESWYLQKEKSYAVTTY